MPFDLSARDRQPEVMDQPGLERMTHQHALAGLATTNCWGTTRHHIWNSIHQIARRRRLRSLTILDIASGAGDLAMWLVRSARAHSIDICVEGCDISPFAVEYANQLSSERKLNEVSFFTGDVLNTPEWKTYDFVTCSLFLHHLEETEAIQLLQVMTRVARCGIVIDDLDRSLLGYVLARWGAKLITRSQIVHNDGPLSVRAAFKRHEVLHLTEQAGLENVKYSRHWPERFLLTWEKPCTAANAA